MSNLARLAEIRDNLVGHFSLDELRSLCADLNVDFDELRGETKTAKADALLERLDHRDGIPQLIAKLVQLRPNVAWREMDSTASNEPYDSGVDAPTSVDARHSQGMILDNTGTVNQHFGDTKNVFTEETAYNVSGLPNPYLGLQAFTYAERNSYAGREREIADATATLTQPGAPCTLLFITGASGSGKSSFAQAGLIPALEAHYAKRNVMVRSAIIRPSADPTAQLRDAREQFGLPPTRDVLSLQNSDAASAFVLILDQFEEFFTQSPKDQRVAIFTQLVALPPFEQSRLHIIATVRSDFLDELFQHKALYDIAKRGVDLRAMTVDELKAAIQAPLRQAVPDASKRFEPALLDKLAQDAHAQAGYLPLLQVTLQELWKNGHLKLSAYRALTDAIREHSEAVFAYTDFERATPQQPRTPAAQAMLMNILLALVKVSPDDDARQDVRQPRDKAELVQGSSQRAALVEQLIAARLLSTQRASERDEQVDLIHETLIANWARLSQAIGDQRQQLQQRARFEGLLDEWQTQHKRNDYLLSGVRLAEARSLSERKDIALQRQDAQSFLTQSLGAAQSRQRRIIAGLSGLLVVALVASGFAFVARQQAVDSGARAETASTLAVSQQSTAEAATKNAIAQQATAVSESKRANEQATIAKSQELGAQALANQERGLDLSFLLSVEAWRTAPTFEARSDMLNTLQYSTRLNQYGHDHTAAVWSVAFSPNGKILASASVDNTVILWDVTDLAARRATIKAHNGSVNSVAFSPDGKTLASASSDNTIILWDVTDPATPKTLGSPLKVHTDSVNSVAFSPDGKTFASASSDKTVILWNIVDPSKPKILGSPLKIHTEMVNSVAFSPDGKTLASASSDKTVILWDVTDPATPKAFGSPLKVHTVSVNSVAFSPDGKTLASASWDRTVILWDVSDSAFPKVLGVLLEAHTSFVWGVAFSPDGKTLASASEDSSVILWDVTNLATPKIRGSSLKAHTNRVLSVAFSPDGMFLASSDADNAVILWSVTNPTAPKALGTLLKDYTDRVNRVTFSPDGKTLASANDDNTIILWDIANPAAPKTRGVPLNAHIASVRNVAFSPDGKTLASASSDKTVILWDVTDSISAKAWGVALKAHSDEVWSVTFSPDSKTLASAGADNTIIFWNVTNPIAPKAIGTPLKAHTDWVNSVAFSPDGKTLASAGEDGTFIFWDVTDPAAPKALRAPLKTNNDRMLSVTFSPDGKMLASASADNTITLWDVRDRFAPKALGTPLKAHTNSVFSVAFSPDGKTLASVSSDKTVILWDITNPVAPRVLGSLLNAHTNRIFSVAFSPDGKTLVSASMDTVILWDVDVDSWARKACHIANRNLTHAEWQRYLGDEPYRKTCPDLPDGA